LASRKENKFEGIAWRRSDQGNPILESAVAYVECTREAIYEAGDHLIVLGRVTGLGLENSTMPLLFFRGGYGAFLPLSMAAGDVDLVDRLRIVDLVRGDMEATASEFGTEVTAVSLVRDELVLTAAAGRATTATFPTRVGQRLPFMPPVGGVFAAWGSSAVRESWLSHVEVDADATIGPPCEEMIERIRSRGYAIGIGHERSQQWEDASFRASTGDPLVTTEVLRRRIAAVSDDYNPKDLAEGTNHEFRFAQVPVFDANGEVVLALTLWGPAGAISKARIDEFTAGLVDMAVHATATIGGQPPKDYPATVRTS
jgi:DNA-binding IclR family transcriptional regulator